MYVQYNPNPKRNLVEDCTVRALCKIFGLDWDNVYMTLVSYGLEMKDMPDSNVVWGKCLQNHGFKRQIIPDYCPECYTIEEFCRDHPRGTYAVATGRHVVAVIDGKYYDSWDSGNEVPIYFWEKEN